MANNYFEGKMIKRKRMNQDENVKKDIYELLVDDIIIPKIRSSVYQWDPKDKVVNMQFVGLFKKLSDVIPEHIYGHLLKNLIIPRLNDFFDKFEGDQHVLCDEDMMECILSWDFVFDYEGHRYW